MRLIDADALLIEYDKQHEGEPGKARKLIENTPTVVLEKESPKRVLWTGWKGHRDTRYRCPNCRNTVKNDDVYCHRCGQKLMFPKVSFTSYVEGQIQQLIVRWDDETD